MPAPDLSAGAVAGATRAGYARRVSTIEALGAQVRRSFVSNSFAAGGVQVSSSQLTRLEIILPRPTPIQASFRKESWGDAIVKVFKKELQTGDAEFDKLVYISTDTPEKTAAFLTAELRSAIGLTVDTGGSVEIDGAKVIAHSVGHSDEDDASILQIVRALLAFSA